MVAPDVYTAHKLICAWLFKDEDGQHDWEIGARIGPERFRFRPGGS